MTPWVSGNLFHRLENGEAFFTRVFKCIAAARQESSAGKFQVEVQGPIVAQIHAFVHKAPPGT